jgi:hypothetical protein
MKLPPNTTMPAVAKPRAPKRSERKPDTCPATTLPAVKALMRNRLSWKSGSLTMRSMPTNAARRTAPAASRRKIAGSAMMTTEPSTADMNTARLVFDRATHL